MMGKTGRPHGSQFRLGFSGKFFSQVNLINSDRFLVNWKHLPISCGKDKIVIYIYAGEYRPESKNRRFYFCHTGNGTVWRQLLSHCQPSYLGVVIPNAGWASHAYCFFPRVLSKTRGWLVLKLRLTHSCKGTRRPTTLSRTRCYDTRYVDGLVTFVCLLGGLD